MKGQVLIGVVRHKKDLSIILKKHCYRIPLSHCPIQKFDYIAFYETSRLGKEGKAINYYARLKTKSEAKRVELLPDEPEHPRAEENYRVYHLGNIQRTPKKIENRSRRRISFGFTTREKLLHSEEISQLFGIPPLEEIMAKELERRKIGAYREYPLRLTKTGRYRLDFAIISQHPHLSPGASLPLRDAGATNKEHRLACLPRCEAWPERIEERRKRNSYTIKIDVECDNEKWHLRPSQKQKDRIRDRALKRIGWTVLRFRGKEILKNVSGCVDKIEKVLE